MNSAEIWGHTNEEGTHITINGESTEELVQLYMEITKIFCEKLHVLPVDHAKALLHIFQEEEQKRREK